ncbi:hypothetical protein FDH82_gp75 [Roseobacter phage RDJL Phi 2]|uniref:Uncharacterized protein n=1 Tax=Roseobacter phage RDJL Phi 2 TaxID=1682380 RepID=A0A0K0PVM0_9CAUD|nr:hypothetical protein FDH82_gp75 [Roseobacter phage RDJL Phi 2]AKQ75865.1 hypothetical protein RDJLphi2_gp75 [Roseobacter phage RDJL Phi 2]
MTTETQTPVEQDPVRMNALLEELRVQRAFLGDRATNLAGDLAQAMTKIEELHALLAVTAKERDEWKTKAKSQMELALDP